MFWIYIVDRFNIHLRGHSCEEVGNQTLQLSTTSQHHIPAQILPRNYMNIRTHTHTHTYGNNN